MPGGPCGRLTMHTQVEGGMSAQWEQGARVQVQTFRKIGSLTNQSVWFSLTSGGTLLRCVQTRASAGYLLLSSTFGRLAKEGRRRTSVA